MVTSEMLVMKDWLSLKLALQILFVCIFFFLLSFLDDLIIFLSYCILQVTQICFSFPSHMTQNTHYVIMICVDVM